MKQSVTEEEARTKWCRHRGGNCIASECMDWAWTPSEDIFLDNYVPEGHCEAKN